jgi:hypothetical protein
MPKVYFLGSAGRIEGMYYQSENPLAESVLVLHPHPLYGGTMNNTIIYNISKLFVENGFSVLRINFRGVGNSDGSFSNGVGELEDASTALNWLYSYNQRSSRFWVAGFSFGAWIGMQLLMRRPEIERFIAVSPPVSRYNFSFFSPCPIPGAIFQGGNDEIAIPEATTSLYNKTVDDGDGVNVSYDIIEDADHFFLGKEQALYEKVDSYIKSSLDNKVAATPIKQRRRQKKKRILDE